MPVICWNGKNTQTTISVWRTPGVHARNLARSRPWSPAFEAARGVLDVLDIRLHAEHLHRFAGVLVPPMPQQPAGLNWYGTKFSADPPSTVDAVGKGRPGDARAG
jgi:hypothetical protein